MTGAWLQHAILRAASLLAPANQRAEWLGEWRTELWYIPQRHATAFCLGSFRDALWVRRNQPIATDLTSPLRCILFLAVVSAAGMFVAACLLNPLQSKAVYWRLSVADLPVACLLTSAISCLLLPPTLAIFGAGPWPARLRWWAFLAVKLALLQPVFLCGLFIWILLAPVAPVAPVGVLALWIPGLRWVFADQQRRCPVCLRMLTNTVRIGAASHTFLDWHGDESMCSHGHGLLQEQSYSREVQWLRLDASWSALFPNSRGGRQS